MSPTDLRTITEAAERCPRPVHRSTMHGWIKDGLTTRDGRRVHLDATQIGKRWFVTDEQIAEFLRIIAEGSAKIARQRKGVLR